MAKAKKKSSGAVDARKFMDREFGPLTFGQAMHGIRGLEDTTLAAFAKRLGISEQHLSDIEKGRRGVSAERAAEWASKLGHPPDVLVRLALQRELDNAGIKLKVIVEATPRARKAAKAA